MKRFIGKILFLTILITFFSGVIRHDVNLEEHLELAQEKQFDCVGRIYKDTLASGSCVLINERFVLTAAHVFIDSEQRPDTVQIDGQKVILFTPYNHRVTNESKIKVEFNGKKVEVKKLTLHPDYDLTKGGHDIAIIELESPISTISPAYTNSEYDELNSNVVTVGYGASGPGDRPDLVKPLNTKIAGENVIDSIAGKKYMNFDSLLFSDFDHPTKKELNQMGSAEPRPLEYMVSGGDSGGGLFREKNENWELVGIVSGTGPIDINQFSKTGYYGMTMNWTRVSAFKVWILENIK